MTSEKSCKFFPGLIRLNMFTVFAHVENEWYPIARVSVWLVNLVKNPNKRISLRGIVGKRETAPSETLLFQLFSLSRDVIVQFNLCIDCISNIFLRSLVTMCLVIADKNCQFFIIIEYWYLKKSSRYFLSIHVIENEMRDMLISNVIPWKDSQFYIDIII